MGIDGLENIDTIAKRNKAKAQAENLTRARMLERRAARNANRRAERKAR